MAKHLVQLGICKQMIEQTAQEVAAAMQENPKAWAEQYLDLLQQLHDIHQLNRRLTLSLAKPETQTLQ